MNSIKLKYVRINNHWRWSHSVKSLCTVFLALRPINLDMFKTLKKSSSESLTVAETDQAFTKIISSSSSTTLRLHFPDKLPKKYTNHLILQVHKIFWNELFSPQSLTDCRKIWGSRWGKRWMEFRSQCSSDEQSQ